jgi:hypothetical protein
MDKDMDRTKIATQPHAQRFILAVRDARQCRSPHHSNTTAAPQAPLEALP